MKKLRDAAQYYRLWIMGMTLVSLPFAWMWSSGWGIAWTCAVVFEAWVIWIIEEEG